MGGTVSYKGRALLNCGSRKDKMENDQYDLTDREKELVRSTWIRLMERSNEVSIDIFLRIFEKIPQAKQFFPFKNAVGDALLKHPYFKGHAMRFFNAVRMTVLNLDAWEIVLIPNLIKLGQQHADIQGFQHDYFDVFRKAMNEVFSKYLGRAYTSETRTAWNKIFSLITDKVEEGYLEGQEIKTRRESQQLQAKADHDLPKMTSKMCPLSENRIGKSTVDQEYSDLFQLSEQDCAPSNEHNPDMDAQKRGCPVKHVTSTDGSTIKERSTCNGDEQPPGGVEDTKLANLHINNNGVVDGLSTGIQSSNEEARGFSDLGNCL